MIAVWPVGPPSSVTIASTLARSSAAVSAGARSCATMTDGRSSAGHAGRGQAHRPRDDPVAHRAQVGDPLGEVAAGLLEHRREHLDDAVDRADHRLAGVDPLRARRVRSALSSAICAVAASTSLTVPVDRADCSRSAGGHVGEGRLDDARGRSPTSAGTPSTSSGASAATCGAGRTCATGPTTARRPTPTPCSTCGALDGALTTPPRASRSVASRSTSPSSAASAPSPSAVRVTSSPLRDAERHDEQDAAGVDRLTARAGDGDGQPGLGDGLREQHGGAGVQADAGGDDDGALRHDGSPIEGAGDGAGRRWRRVRRPWRRAPGRRPPARPGRTRWSGRS